MTKKERNHSLERDLARAKERVEELEKRLKDFGAAQPGPIPAQSRADLDQSLAGASLAGTRGPTAARG